MKRELLGEKLVIYTQPDFNFNLDAFLLADFAHIKSTDFICDLGTGCGILSLLIAKRNIPQQIFAVDIQQEAIDLLLKSVCDSNLQTMITPICMDLNCFYPKKPLDAVICNPPYYPEKNGSAAKSLARKIARQETFCRLDDVCKTAAHILKNGGRLYLSHRAERLTDVLTAMRKYRLEPKKIRFIASRFSASPWLFLVEGILCANPSLTVVPTLYIYEGQKYSAEMMRIYQSFDYVRDQKKE